MNPWLRPSIQQPRWISNTIKTIFKPIIFPLTIVKNYWDDWHKVYDPPSNNDKP